MVKDAVDLGGSLQASADPEPEAESLNVSRKHSSYRGSSGCTHRDFCVTPLGALPLMRVALLP